MYSVLRCMAIMAATCTVVASIPSAPRAWGWGPTRNARSLEERAFKGAVRYCRLPPATQARLPQAVELPTSPLSSALAVRGGGESEVNIPIALRILGLSAALAARGGNEGKVGRPTDTPYLLWATVLLCTALLPTPLRETFWLIHTATATYPSPWRKAQDLHTWLCIMIVNFLAHPYGDGDLPLSMAARIVDCGITKAAIEKIKSHIYRPPLKGYMRFNFFVVVLLRLIQAVVKLLQLPWLIRLEMKLWVGWLRYPTDEKCTRWLVDHTIGILKTAGIEPHNGFEVRCLQVVGVVVETLVKIATLVTVATALFVYIFGLAHIEIWFLGMCGVPVPELYPGR